MPTEREMIYDCIVWEIKSREAEARGNFITRSLLAPFAHKIYRVKVFVFFGSARRLLYNINLNIRRRRGWGDEAEAFRGPTANRGTANNL